MNFKKAKVVMLSHNNIDTSLTLYKTESGKPLHLSTNLDILSHHTNQHLYIISDDEIKEGDWYLDISMKSSCYGLHKCDSKRLEVITKEFKNVAKKVIATTDTSLYIHQEETFYLPERGFYLPQPSQQFIEKYIEEYNKGNVITDVLVEYEHFDELGNYIDNNYHFKGDIWKLKINPKDNTITIKKVKDNWNREEVIKLLRDAHLDIVDGNYSKGLNKWIEENL